MLPGQTPGKSSQRDSIELWLESGKSGKGTGVESGLDSLKSLVFSCEWNIAEESASGEGLILGVGLGG